LLKKDVEKGRLTDQDLKDTKSRITTSTNINDLQNTDIVIEAVTENRELKLNIFRDLSKNLPPNVILATNTSSISITKIAAATNRPDKIIGMHFVNPYPPFFNITR
jgi:3-hydroxybutyryl-CoA dehydrogenase